MIRYYTSPAGSAKAQISQCALFRAQEVVQAVIVPRSHSMQALTHCSMLFDLNSCPKIGSAESARLPARRAVHLFGFLLAHAQGSPLRLLNPGAGGENERNAAALPFRP
jgi:hypothetical protein